jgi:hypothetical protein
MLKRIIRKLAITAAALAAAGGLSLAVAGAAGASTITTTGTAGYQVSGAQFRYFQTTVYARSVAQYDATMGAGFGHGITLTSGVYTLSLGISVYQGDVSASPWDAAFDVTKTADGSQVGGCLAGNPSGTGGVTCNTSVTGEPGAFAPGNVTLSIFYNTSNGVVSFSATQGTNSLHGTFTAGTGISFRQADAGTTLADPSTVTRPSSAQLMGRFTGTRLTNYKGNHFTLTGPWLTQKVQATTAGSVKLLTPSALSDGGADFSTYLQP